MGINLDGRLLGCSVRTFSLIFKVLSFELFAILYYFLLVHEKCLIISVIYYHHKSWIPIFGNGLTVVGWWAWNLFLSVLYGNTVAHTPPITHSRSSLGAI